jgi:predicted secreted protein
LVCAITLLAYGVGAEGRMDLSREAIERMLAGGGRISLNGRDLSGLDLSGLSLDGVDFSYAKLEHANLARSSFKGAVLWAVHAPRADLSGSDLRGAKLGTADLSGANLSGADLRGADLLGTNLSLADLSGANLEGARLTNAVMVRVTTDAATRWSQDFSPGRQPVSDVLLTRADAGKHVEIRPGDTLTIRLPENPTTGYRWQLASEGAVPSMAASLVSSNFAPSTSTAAGAGGERTLTFAARDPGRSRMRLVYKQPWLNDSDAAETFEIELVVVR